MQKISSFHQVILEIKSILESCNQAGHTHLWPCPPQFFDQLLIYVNLSQHGKKSGYFIDLFWGYGRLKNPGIWLAENILTHISGTKIFANVQLVQEHSQLYKFSL